MTILTTTQTTAQDDHLLRLHGHPGHLLRRAQQISASLFHEEYGVITPVQYAVLLTIMNHPGIDQVSLAGLSAIDTSTAASVCVRLEEKEWITRNVIPHNKRQRALHITEAGQSLILDLIPAAHRVEQRILSPFTAQESADFMRLLNKLVATNNDLSRAPMMRQGNTEAEAAAS